MMTAILQWTTANPVRAFLAAGLAVFLPLPVAGALVVAALLASGASAALAAAAGAAIATALASDSLFGSTMAAAIALLTVMPWVLGAFALERSRSLSFAFQALTMGCCLLALVANGLLGDPVSTLAPVIRKWADMLAGAGFPRVREEIGTVTAGISWGRLAWLVLVQAFIALCAGLWVYGRGREPGLFGREFRQLRLGGFPAWLLVVAFATSVIGYRFAADGWPAADDLVFVLAAAFLVQALAVVHGLRELQVIGPLPVVLAYVAVLLVPMALVGIGFADTWIRFRERFAPRQGV